MPVRLSSLSVYSSHQDPADPGEEPFLTMTFPVANHTFLDSVVQANRRMYNNAALAIILIGTSKRNQMRN